MSSTHRKPQANPRINPMYLVSTARECFVDSGLSAATWAPFYVFYFSERQNNRNFLFTGSLPTGMQHSGLGTCVSESGRGLSTGATSGAFQGLC